MLLTDDLGRAFEVERPFRRIISLAPAISENLFAIGAGGLLIGVTTADDYPAQVKKLPRIGDFGQPAYERIRTLRPDLAIVDIATVDRATVENAERRLKVPIFVQMSKQYRDVPRHLEQLGKLTGRRDKANALAKQMRQTETAVMKRIAGKPRPTVFVEISANPLYTAGPGSFVDDLLRITGGANIVKGSNAYPQYSKERLLIANPDYYIVAVGGDMGGTTKNTLDPPLDRLVAARKGRIRRIPADFLFRPTPRLMQGVLALEKALHQR